MVTVSLYIHLLFFIDTNFRSVVAVVVHVMNTSEASQTLAAAKH